MTDSDRRLWACPGCSRTFRIPGDQPDPALCPQCSEQQEHEHEPAPAAPSRTLSLPLSLSLFADVMLYLAVAWSLFGFIVFMLGVINSFSGRAPANEAERIGEGIGRMVGLTIVIIFWALPPIMLCALSVAARFMEFTRRPAVH